MKKISTLLRTLAVTLTLVGTASAAYAEYDGPEIRYFYPGMGYEGWYETPNNLKLYAYFAKNVWEAKAQVVQDDNVVGTLVFDTWDKNTSSTKAGSSPMTDPDRNGNKAVFNALQPDKYTIQLIEVTWEEDGVKKTYNDGTPFGPVGNFIMFGSPASLVSETLLGNNTMKSYYPLDSTDGKMTFTFDKAINPTTVHPHFIYGTNESNEQIVSIDWYLSEDGKTITIDLRGHLYNVATLAPGVVFYDDNGNETDPPTTIALEMAGIQATDGSRVITYLPMPTGGIHQYKGVYKNFSYIDITHATPALTGARFYASSNPSQTYADLSSDLDMMALSVADLDVVATADVQMQKGSVTEVVPFASLTVGTGVLNVPVPSTLYSAGDMIVTLVNVTYKQEDGAEHNIRPINLSRLTKEVFTVEALLAAEKNTTIDFVIKGGFKITLANEAGYCFGEDSTAGVQIVTSTNEALFQEGTLLKGTLTGKMVDNGQFMPDMMASQVTYSTDDISVGTLLYSLEDALTGRYDNCLITLVGNYTVNGDNIMLETLPVVTDYVEGFVAPEKVTSVTGVLYNSPFLVALIARNMDDFNQIEDVPEQTLTDVSEVRSLEAGAEFTLNLQNAKVTFEVEGFGSIIEDANGAIAMVDSETMEGIAPMGSLINGTVKGVFYGSANGMELAIIYAAESDFTVEDADVTAGREFTLNDLRNPDNNLRLVTLTNSDDTPLVTNSIVDIEVGEGIYFVDLFETLGDDYEFPEKVDKVTGILFFMEAINIFEEGDGLIEYPTGTNIFICPRSLADISASTSGIQAIDAQGEAQTEVYNLQGVKVREAGQSLEGLSRGIYVVKGQKVLVK